MILVIRCFSFLDLYSWLRYKIKFSMSMPRIHTMKSIVPLILNRIDAWRLGENFTIQPLYTPPPPGGDGTRCIAASSRAHLDVSELDKISYP